MKLFKLYFGQPVKINLKKVDEETKKVLKGIFKSMNETLDLENECLPMVAMKPCKKGYEVAPSKELGAMGHNIEVPRQAIIVPDSPEIKIEPTFDPEMSLPKREPTVGFGMTFDDESEEVPTPAVAEVEPEKSPLESEDYEKELFKQRIKNIIQKLDSWQGSEDEK